MTEVRVPYHSGMGGGFSSQTVLGERLREAWPCDFCQRNHYPGPAGGSSKQPSVYCPELGARVYSADALREHVGRCPP